MRLVGIEVRVQRTGADGQPILARMVLSCCAADGRPVKLAFNSMPTRHGQMVTVRIFDSAMLSAQALDNLVLSPRVATTPLAWIT